MKTWPFEGATFTRFALPAKLARAATSKSLSRLPPIAGPAGGSRLATTRWRTVEDFLNDLPRFHCTMESKPSHSLCTVCLRINHAVAFDCPLREIPDAPQARYEYKPRPAEVLEGPRPFNPASAEDVPAAVLAEGPVIEFAPAPELPAKKRMKAKPVEKRTVGGAPAPPSASADAPGEGLSEPETGSAGGGTQAGGDDDLAKELKGWDPESAAAPQGFRAPELRPPEAEAPSSPAEKESKRGRWRKR